MKVVPLLKYSTTLWLQTKSYKPVSLLSVFGKMLERKIVLHVTKKIDPVWSGLQHGFTAEKSAISAFEDLLTWHDTRVVIDKMSVIVFLDISGTSVHLNWRTLLEDLKDLELSWSLIDSFLRVRTTRMTVERFVDRAQLTRKAPHH